MTLTALAVTFVLVAAIFTLAGLITARWTPPGGPGPAAGPPAASSFADVWPAAAFEALALTLLAALWFDSLGQGGWVLLFLLLGALAGTDRWLGPPLPGRRRGGGIRLFVASLLKYLLAGAVCVWRLT